MKRLTVSIDDESAQVLADYAACAGCSQASVVRSLLVAIAPTFRHSVDLYKQAQDCGTESVKVLQRAVSQMETDIVPKQQAFLRDWNALIARTSEDMEKAANGGHSEFENL